MNETTAIIPLSPSTTEAAHALVWGARQFGPAQLAHTTAAQLRRVMRELYSEARKRGVLRALKQGLVEVSDRTPGGELIFQTAIAGLRVLATLDADMGLQVQRDSSCVLDDRAKLGADVIFAPGEWLPGLLEAVEADRWAREQRAAAAEERAALAVVQQLKAGL